MGRIAWDRAPQARCLSFKQHTVQNVQMVGMIFSNNAAQRSTAPPRPLELPDSQITDTETLEFAMITAVDPSQLVQYLEVKLAANGYEGALSKGGFLPVVRDLIESYRERSRQLKGYLCPPDRRIQDFLDAHFADAPVFYVGFGAVTVIGAGVVLIPGAPLITILVVTQALNAVLLLPILVFMYRVARDRDLLGEYTASPLMAAAYLVAIAAIGVCVAALAVLSFG